jgi:hypothetical protein
MSMRPLKSVSAASLLCLLLATPVLISSTNTGNLPAGFTAVTPESIRNATIAEEANAMYDSINLKRFGLSKAAFEFAWKGYKNLLESGKIQKKDVLSICDFSQSSRRKRLYIIDVEERKVLVNTYVAHGRRSGGEYARSFSNSPESHKSSLGFYVTRKTYYGGHGLALTIEGLEYGINHKADERRIVIHGSQYVGANFLRSNKFNGRSFGCPAVPAKDTYKVINTIKDGSCLFIYHPTKNYISKSKILNG